MNVQAILTAVGFAENSDLVIGNDFFDFGFDGRHLFWSKRGRC
jgi:hypothetical protein